MLGKACVGVHRLSLSFKSSHSQVAALHFNVCMCFSSNSVKLCCFSLEIRYLGKHTRMSGWVVSNHSVSITLSMNFLSLSK